MDSEIFETDKRKTRANFLKLIQIEHHGQRTKKGKQTIQIYLANWVAPLF